METTKSDLLWGSERERILKALSELCASEGYEAVTVAAITDRAGVSEEDFGSIFAGGKEEAMIAAMNAVLADTLAAISGAYSNQRSELESTLSGVRGILELMAARPSDAYLAFISGRQMGPSSALEIHETGVRAMAMMLDRLWEFSASEVQPPRYSAAAIGGAEAIVRRELVAGRHAELPRLLPDFIYAATVGYLGQEEALRLARAGREVLAGTRWAVE